MKAYVKSRLDGAGAVINEELFVYAHCFKNQLEYIGSYGFNTTIKNHFENHYALSQFLNLPLPVKVEYEITNLHKDELVEIKEHHYSPDVYPNVNQLLDESFINMLRTKFCSKLSCHPVVRQKPQVAIHIRRGDVKIGNTRYTPNSYYVDIIENLKAINPNFEITIFSQSESSEPFSEFIQLGCKLQLDTDLVSTWKEMIFADVLVMSKGSFSYVPAIYNSNFVIFQPAWYIKLNHWHHIEDPNLWSDVKDSIGILNR